jgi:hypothetical protein
MKQITLSVFCCVFFSNLTLAATPTIVRDWTHPSGRNFYRKCGPPQNISVYKFNSCQGSSARVSSQTYQICQLNTGNFEIFSFFRCPEKPAALRGYDISLIQSAAEADFLVTELHRIEKNQRAAKNIKAGEDTGRVILEVRGKFPNHNSP